MADDGRKSADGRKRKPPPGSRAPSRRPTGSGDGRREPASRSAGSQPPAKPPRPAQKSTDGGRGDGSRRADGGRAPGPVGADRGRGAAPRGSGRPDRPAREKRPERSQPASSAPEIAAAISWHDLESDVRRQLTTLPKALAQDVGRRLVAAALSFETDPELAFLHAEEAGRLASRVAAAREAVGLTAYATGRWEKARAELRAARRLSGSDEFLPIIADCERGMGHPERALEIAGGPEAAGLKGEDAVEMRIVASGARRDLGQVDAAVVTLQCPELRQTGKPWTARLRYAYADALLAAGRQAEAIEWFQRSAASDPSGETESAERLDELTGTTFMDDEELLDAADDDQAGSDST